MSKNTTILGSILLVGLVLIGYSFFRDTDQISTSTSPSPSASLPMVSSLPAPTGDGRTTFTDEQVPWALLLKEASCELKGEIKFVSASTYDNQDALFTYKGIDNPGRNIAWSISPNEEIKVGPNLFARMPIPNGESLLSIYMPKDPKYKKYELTAKIQYGRLVDEQGKFVPAGGNVRVFEKVCKGKTTIVLP